MVKYFSKNLDGDLALSLRYNTDSLQCIFSKYQTNYIYFINFTIFRPLFYETGRESLSKPVSVKYFSKNLDGDLGLSLRYFTKSIQCIFSKYHTNYICFICKFCDFSAPFQWDGKDIVKKTWQWPWFTLEILQSAVKNKLNYVEISRILQIFNISFANFTTFLPFLRYSIVCFEIVKNIVKMSLLFKYILKNLNGDLEILHW